MTEFVSWGKTARYFRPITITEKIDGTNAAVVIEELPFGTFADPQQDVTNLVAIICGPNDPELEVPTHEYAVYAQSRKRLITPQSDNAGFARWVEQHAHTLVRDLGPGRHFGEWWGLGIQRGYGMKQKVFSLFNTRKWHGVEFGTPNLSVVPILYEGPHSESSIRDALDDLRVFGSAATQDFDDHTYDNPEGVIVYHAASNGVFKVTLTNDETPKSLAA